MSLHHRIGKNTPLAGYSCYSARRRLPGRSGGIYPLGGLDKTLPRSCQELRLEQSWPDRMWSWQDLGKILSRSNLFSGRIDLTRTTNRGDLD